MTTPVATLRASLEHHNSVFESLLKLIPAKHYLARDPDGEEAGHSLLDFLFVLTHRSLDSMRPNTRRIQKNTRLLSRLSRRRQRKRGKIKYVTLIIVFLRVTHRF
jgi:60S ribosome biogenesis protein Rrp14